MTIQFKCESCGKALKVDDSKAGKRVKCPGCQDVITIPQPLEAEEEKDEFDFGSSQDDDDDDDRGEALPRKSKTKTKGKPKRSARRTTAELAGLGKRFLGAFVDGLAGMLLIVPGYVIMIAGAVNQDRRGEPKPEAILLGLGLLVLGFFVLIGIQVYLLATRSQSIGKLLLGTQIMDYETDEPAGFVKTFLLRMLVNGFLGVIPLYGLIDILFIFGEEHRCIHDQLAGTYVADIS